MIPQDKQGVEWLLITVFAFLGGVVANIIVPSRRGAWGFIGAAVIGMFCGGAAGMAAASFGVHTGWQVIISAGSGVLGDRILTAVLMATHPQKFNVTINGGRNNMGGQSIGDNANIDTFQTGENAKNER